MLITYNATLLKKQQMNNDTFVFSFSRPENADWTFKAGQYMILHIPQLEGMAARRLYSIASAPHETDTLDLLIQLVPGGIAGNYLSKMNVGEEVKMQGPAGLFTFKDISKEKELMFLATGTGIAPIRSIIMDLAETGFPQTRVNLFWGMKTFEDLYYLEEFQNLCKKFPNFNLHLCLSRQEKIEELVLGEDVHYIRQGRIMHMLDTYDEPSLQQAYFYLCGGKEVVESLRQYLAERNIDKTAIHFEKFT